MYQEHKLFYAKKGQQLYLQPCYKTQFSPGGHWMNIVGIIMTNYVRPETVINALMSPDWRPYIQTPPFSEYKSGHVVISLVTAEILTARLGDNIAFRNISKAEFGIAKREFKSFRAAAVEAATSRVYGGIYYKNRSLISNEQGKQVAGIILTRQKLKTFKFII